MKTCSNPSCKQNNPQPLTSFYKKPMGKDGLTARCKECVNTQTKAWIAKNKDKKKAAVDKYRFKNRDKVNANTRKWAKQNPGKRNAQTMKRIAAKRRASPPWLTGEHWVQIEVFYIEAARLTKETGIPYEVDHIEPLQGRNVSGLHVPWNLDVKTRASNRSKNNRRQ